MKEVNAYHLDVESHGKLKIEQAKELYLKAMNCTDEGQKKAYMDKLIVGTLYVVYNFIEKNGLKLLENSIYDIEDIQSTFVEVWIKKIRSGELLNVDNYSLMFNRLFYNEVTDILVGDGIPIRQSFSIQSDKFVDLLFDYIVLKNYGKEFDVDALIDKYRALAPDGMPDLIDKKQIAEILESIYTNLQFNKTDDLKVARTKIKNFLKMFICSGMQMKITENERSKDMYEKVIHDTSFEHFSDVVDDSIESERGKIIIHERFGLDGKPKNYKELSEEYGVGKGKIVQLEAKALRDLRGSDEMKQYADDYNIENRFNSVRKM